MQGCPYAKILDRIQDYLRHSAARQYESQPVPPFTVYFHPQDSLPYFNYAIPDAHAAGEPEVALATLGEAFCSRQRRPRFEFIADCFPDLPAILDDAGYIQEARQVLMVCTAETLTPAPSKAGLTVQRLGEGSLLDDVRDMLSVQARGFDPESDGAVTEYEAQCYLQGMGEGAAFLARLTEQPAGAGMYTTPWQGLVELVGVATLPFFRRRGIATTLVGEATRDALARGADAVCLVAADEGAGQMYERVGFRPVGTMLAYVVQEIPIAPPRDENPLEDE
jgi:GNAT superfamily N-acetyltransferase